MFRAAGEATSWPSRWSGCPAMKETVKDEAFSKPLIFFPAS